MDRSAGRFCSASAKDGFAKSMRQQVWHANGLMLLNSVLVAAVVGVVAYIPRGRRHPSFRFLFTGASTLFLPVITEMASTVTSPYNNNVGFINGPQVLGAFCEPGTHVILVFVWAGLVLVIATNTSAVVAGDEREGRNIDPSMELLFKALWLAYLTFSAASLSRFRRTTDSLARELNKNNLGRDVTAIFGLLYAIAAYKLFQRYLAFYMAQRSVALGRNPRLIVGYIANPEENDPSPDAPALIVKGEETVQVKELPSGYFFKGSRNCLVTFDRVLLSGQPKEHKDLCFSFALFKLLRCRFAKYGILEAGFTRGCKFFRCTYLQGGDYERVFRVLADELSFIHDYYYSSLPVSYSMSLIPFLNILVSLLSIAYCTYMFTFIRQALHQSTRAYDQITCRVWCPEQRAQPGVGSGVDELGFGSKYFDALPVCLVLAVVMLSEIRDIIAYICSNWTKVDLICKYIIKDSWKKSPVAQKCIGFVFKYCRCRLVTNWDEKMYQCSLLVLHQWPLLRLPRRLLRLPRRLLHLPEGKKKVKLPRAVKAAIFEALKGEGLTSEQALLKIGKGRTGETIMHIRPPSFPVSAGSTTGMIYDNAFSACDFKGIADTILAWHIATSIFEMKEKEQPDSGTRKEQPKQSRSENRRSKKNPPQSSDSDEKIIATHLSRYCAYLVACRPELLPDDDDWCKKLYWDVLDVADCALHAARGAGFQQVIKLLKKKTDENEVLKNGAMLAEELVKDDSNIGWKDLADFWSEVVLYIAPSENLDGHAEAIARGGELVTLLWALLAHAGIVDRLVEAATKTSTVAGDPPNTSAEEAPETASDHHV